MGMVIGILPGSLGAVGMLVVQTVINFFISSGSGLAVASMPIMAPLANLVNLPRIVAVTAYQYGDGFSNFIWPTSCAPQIAVTGTGFSRWYKFMALWFVMIFVLQCICIMVCAVIFGA